MPPNTIHTPPSKISPHRKRLKYSFPLPISPITTRQNRRLKHKNDILAMQKNYKIFCRQYNAIVKIFTPLSKLENIPQNVLDEQHNIIMNNILPNVLEHSKNYAKNHTLEINSETLKRHQIEYKVSIRSINAVANNLKNLCEKYNHINPNLLSLLEQLNQEFPQSDKWFNSGFSSNLI